MSPLKPMLLGTLAALALSACAARPSSPASSSAVGTTTTTSTLLCPNGYVPATDGKTCVLAPLPP